MSNQNTSNKISTQRLVTISLMAAIIFVVTYTIKVPIPFSSFGGYVNLGDAAIYCCAALLGPAGGFLAASVGSALADVLLGAMVYAPATFVIKGLMGLVCGYIIMKQKSFKAFALASFIGGAIMISGYFVFEYFMMDSAYAMASLPFNAVQWIGGTLAALPTYKIVTKVKSMRVATA
ncbi:MAG TPA: ECF transporter S component [Peptococcaceae bacterium]|nr:ECF transporter S component [Peptococcaceae bacterium]